MKKYFAAVLLSALLLLLHCGSMAQITTFSGKKISAAAMNEFIQKEIDSTGMQGLTIAIVNHGKIVYHYAFGIANVDTKTKVDEQSIFEAASMSKPVFAYMVMKMADKGLLNLDTPLYRYLPYPDIEKDERYKLITARIVLTHRTGFPNWRWFNRADSSLHVHYPDLYLKFTPGTQYGYSGEGFYYLAKVIAHLTGRNMQTLELLYEQEVAVPLRMEHAWFTGNPYITKHKVSGHVDGKVQVNNGLAWPTSFPEHDSSFFNPASSLHCDAVSYASFIINWMKGRELRKATLEEMLKPQYQLPEDPEKPNEHPAVGLGIFMASTPYGIRYQHGGNNGNFQSNFVWYKSLKSGFVYLTNCNKSADFDNRLQKFLTNGK